MNTILITGSRDYARLPLVRSWLYGWINNPSGTAVDALYVGDARGVDREAAKAWMEFTGKLPRIFKAEWAQHGKAAGIIRNKQMVDALPPGAGVFGFWDFKSNGTKQCMDYAHEKGFATFLVDGFTTVDTEKGSGDLIMRPWVPGGLRPWTAQEIENIKTRHGSDN